MWKVAPTGAGKVANEDEHRLAELVSVSDLHNTVYSLE